MSANLNHVNPGQSNYANAVAHNPPRKEPQEMTELAEKKAEQLERSSKVSETLINKKIEEINESLRPYSRYIEREVHEVTRSIMYKLKNSKTNEVIDEFPPSRIQDLVAKIWEMAGLFVDEKA